MEILPGEISELTQVRAENHTIAPFRMVSQPQPPSMKYFALFRRSRHGPLPLPVKRLPASSNNGI